ncbi:SCO-spondin-like [Asterias rubens]|uniref:SCO-spondin-like n=1 Tax=Asterias rubens TaxID=7604 RepID=UPI0014551371|nr:SCO-spondin-like [Asterias rubens]
MGHGLLQCMVLVIVSFGILRCSALGTDLPTDKVCRKVERVYFVGNEWPSISNIFEKRSYLTINQQTRNYVLRWVCCDETEESFQRVESEDCGEAICEGICDEENPECNLESRLCSKRLVDENAEIKGSLYTELPFDPTVDTTIDGDYDGICSFSGGSVRTLDGLNYNYPYNCKHNLVFYQQEQLELTVDILPRSHCANSSCKSTVIIWEAMIDSQVTLGADGVVHYNNKLVDLPYLTSNGQHIYKEGMDIIYEETDNTRVIFDGQNHVVITVSSLYKASDEGESRISGLCGDYDNNPSDDFDSALVRDSEDQFSSGHQCVPLELKYQDPFTYLTNAQQKEVLAICADFASDFRFQECRTKVLIEPFYNSCWFTLSMCTLEDTSCDLCEIYSRYSKSCARHGILVEWRSSHFCPITCDRGMVYNECGSADALTCENYYYSQGTIQSCVPGCECPAGTYFNKDECVPKERCPCSQAEVLFPSGSLMKEKCKVCVCIEGKLAECTPLPCPATCSIVSGSTFRTFDGTHFHFNWQCSYILGQRIGEEGPPFTIGIDKIGCTSLTDCVPYVTVMTSDGTEYRIVSIDELMVTIDGKAAQGLKLPYSSVDGTVTASRLSSMVARIVLPNHGIEIMWSTANGIYLTVQEEMLGKIHGLCGNYNKKQRDDFQLPASSSEVASLADFTPAWNTNASCVEASKLTFLYRCRSEVIETCRQLKRAPFDVCGAKVDVTPYYESCKHDMEYKCSTFVDLNECAILAAYALECANQDVPINWRNDNLCPVSCPDGREYKECGSVCKVTCSDINNDVGCLENCVQGCQCPNGEVESDRSGFCIPVSNCPCVDQGLTYESGETWMGECNNCTCSGGVVTCTTEVCLADDHNGTKGPSICQSNKEWLSCLACERTCENYNLGWSKTNTGKKGCRCKDGMVINPKTTAGGSACIYPSRCPCYYNGQSYDIGATFKKKCNWCQCKPNSKVLCSKKKCPGTCSGYGDPHYLTYDSRMYEFMGACSYVLTTDECYCSDLNQTSASTFKVVVENIICGSAGFTCTKTVTFTFQNVTIVLARGSEPVITPPPQDGAELQYKIRSTLRFVLISTKQGIKLKWDKMTSIHVKLDPDYQGKVCGLCGNFNDDAEDDFQTRSGDVAATPRLFGHSWKTSDSCELPCTDCVDPCENHPGRDAWARFKCNIILDVNGVFEPCHHVVDPDIYYERCLFDSCGCDRGGDCECLCTAISNYAELCTQGGVPIKWRNEGLCCLQCNVEGSTYLPCGKVCPDTCFNTTDDLDCQQLDCVEGCHCPPGKVLHNGRCIDTSICPCQYGDEVVDSGTVFNDDCQECVCGNRMIECFPIPGCYATTTTATTTTAPSTTTESTPTPSTTTESTPTPSTITESTTTPSTTTESTPTPSTTTESTPTPSTTTDTTTESTPTPRNTTEFTPTPIYYYHKYHH